MKKDVIKSTIIVFFISLIAKFLGFGKSMIQASYFGVSAEMDAFNVTSGFVSNVLYMLTSALSVAFIPIYIQHKNDRVGEGNQKIFASRTITVLGLISIVLTLLLYLFTPIIVKIIAPSFTGEVLDKAFIYFRVMIIGIIFSLGAHLYSSVLNAEKIYGFSAICSLVNSIVLIGFIIMGAKKIGVWALVFAYPASFFFQWLMLYVVGREYGNITLKYGIKEESLKLLLIQAAPILLSQATVEINQVVDRALLSGIETGTLTAVSYSAVLYQFVTTIVSTPLSTVLFTELSEAGAKKNYIEIRGILRKSFELIILVCLPIIMITLFSSIDIVTIIYGRGRFNAKAIMDCSEGLRMYILCLLPVSLKSVLNKAYYALGDTKRPMIIGIMEVIVNITLSVILVKPYGIRGVVGATAISCYCFIIVMINDFNHKYIKTIDVEYCRSFWKMLLALLIAILPYRLIENSLQMSALSNFVMCVLTIFGVYIIVLVISGDKIALTILKYLRNKCRKMMFKNK